MKIPQTFHEWLAKQEGREDPIGDLAEDTRRDKEWSRTEGDSFYGIELAIEHHGEHVIEALRDAWEEWASKEVVLCPSRIGFVYFIRSIDNGRIKIGWARDPRKRLSDLQTGCLERLELLRAVPGAVADERDLHHVHKERRVHGEWFEDRDGLIAIHIRTCSRALMVSYAKTDADRAERLGDLVGRMREVSAGTIAMVSRGSVMSYAAAATMLRVSHEVCDALVEEGVCEQPGTVH